MCSFAIKWVLVVQLRASSVKYQSDSCHFPLPVCSFTCTLTLLSFQTLPLLTCNNPCSCLSQSPGCPHSPAHLFPLPLLSLQYINQPISTCSLADCLMCSLFRGPAISSACPLLSEVRLSLFLPVFWLWEKINFCIYVVALWGRAFGPKFAFTE